MRKVPLSPIRETAGADEKIRWCIKAIQDIARASQVPEQLSVDQLPELNEAAQDAVGTILSDAGDIDFTYDDATPAISGAVKSDAVTFAKMQNIATDRLIGRDTASSGDPEEISVGTGLEFSGSGGIRMTANQRTATLVFIIDGGGVAITTGVKGDLEIPFACTINQATLLADQSGSIVVDIWKDVYGSYPPTVEDTITASAKPTISTATKSQDTTLTGWTTSIAAGDTLRFNVDSVTTIQRVLVSLKVTKT